ncbi:MAG: hypothetical protein IT523_00065 [Burkholderiales bacterium]|nr:hypothetical protein [Burkholderiales bacterium]
MTDTCIVDACSQSWEESTSANLPNKNNCSGFLKAVASKLGIVLPVSANADLLIDFMIDQQWKTTTSGKEAANLAENGAFVVAALKSGDHNPARANGHVAVVVSGTLYREVYPLCWCGSIGSAQSCGTKSVGEVWNRRDRDQVTYYRCPVYVCADA